MKVALIFLSSLFVIEELSNTRTSVVRCCTAFKLGFIMLKL